MINTKPSAKHPLAPPRAAAISGVTFSLLMIVGLGLVRYAIPSDYTEGTAWLNEPGHRAAIRLALDVVPFAGIAFMWFMGVVRNRLGALEDQFFATVFLGSGLLFVASLFAVAALMLGLFEPMAANAGAEVFYFCRRVSDATFNIFAIKMAGVFIISTCTIGMRTAVLPRWVAFIGYICAVTLLLVISNWKWITFVFPLWMLLLSCHMLWTEFRSRHGRPA